MSVTFMAMYPNTPNIEFDFEYYTKQHIPMAKKLWANK
ncbi:MAG: EthD family reductase, partial [Rhodospirillaceae bacterium]|nr:EthD family reductase [Rhodospirillaceae bacterium]